MEITTVNFDKHFQSTDEVIKELRKLFFKETQLKMIDYLLLRGVLMPDEAARVKQELEL